MKMRKKKQGASIVTTMVFSSSMLLLAATVIAFSTTVANTDRFIQNKRDAQIMAHSLGQIAIAELKRNPDFGKDGTGSLVLEGESWPGKAEMSFSATEPELSSTYNFDIDSGLVTGGLGHHVPARSIQFVIKSEVGNSTQIYELVLQKRGLEYAVASSGPFLMEGENEAAALDSLDTLRQSDTTTGVPRDEILRSDQKKTSVATAHVDSSGPSMVFDGDLTLYGDAISAGLIEGEDTNVSFFNGGSVKEQSQNVDLPEVDIQSYDPDENQQISPDFIKRILSLIHI